MYCNELELSRENVCHAKVYGNLGIKLLKTFWIFMFVLPEIFDIYNFMFFPFLKISDVSTRNIMTDVYLYNWNQQDFLIFILSRIKTEDVNVKSKFPD